jgi:hypothetical protein
MAITSQDADKFRLKHAEELQRYSRARAAVQLIQSQHRAATT